MKYKINIVLVIAVLLSICCSGSDNFVLADSPIMPNPKIPVINPTNPTTPSVVGNTATISTSNGDIKVTPATLTDSGWVTVEYYSKQLTGDVDVSFGFDGKYDIKPTKVESWEDYSHNRSRQKDGVVQATFPDSHSNIKITSVELLPQLPKDGKVTIGDETLNKNFAQIEYEPLIGNKKDNPKLGIIAYTTYDSKFISFGYQINGKITETYTENYEDWKTSTNGVNKTKSSLNSVSSTDWKTLKAPEAIKLNTWHKMRFWVDMPFGGLNGVQGEYSISIKPSSLSLKDAESQGKLTTIDPWYNSVWTYSKALTINHVGTGTYTDYQMQLIVAESGTVTQNLESSEHSVTSNVGGGDFYARPYFIISSPVSMPLLTKANGRLTIDLKCDHPELMDHSDGQLELTSSGGPDANEWSASRPLPEGVTTSYQTFQLPLSEFHSYGGELDVTHINYIRWYCKTTGADITLFWKNAKISYADVSLESHDSDFSTLNDLRFVTGDNSAQCSYWIESISGVAPNRLATVWVKIPTVLSGGSTVYLYYGNSQAMAISNGDNTLLFFDDFAESSLDPVKWDGTYGTYSLSGGEVTESGYGGLTSANMYPVNTMMRSRSKVSTYSRWSSIITFWQDGNNSVFINTDEWGSPLGYYEQDFVQYAGGWYSDLVGTVDNSYHIAQAMRNGSTDARFNWDDSWYIILPTTVPVGLAKVNTYVAGGVQVYDWLFVASYSIYPPFVSSAGSESNALSAWGYRKALTISSVYGSTLTDYQMKLMVSEGSLGLSRDLYLPEMVGVSDVAHGNLFAGYGMAFTGVNMTGMSKTNGVLSIDMKCDHPELIDHSNFGIELTSAGIGESQEWYGGSLAQILTTSYQTFNISLGNWQSNSGELDVTNINYIGGWAKTTGVDITLSVRNAKIRYADVGCDGHALSNFNDLRFTTSNGNTPCFYWIESIDGSTPNGLATVYIKVPTIIFGSTTLYMYYGNGNTIPESSGSSVFVSFDDFESGNSGDYVGMPWIEYNPWIIFSTVHHYGLGSKSAKSPGNDSYYGICQNINPSSHTGYSWEYYGDTSSAFMLMHWDGVHRLFVFVYPRWNVAGYYGNDSNWHWIGTSPVGQWESIQIKNVDWTLATFDFYQDNSLLQNGCTMSSDAINANQLLMQGNNESGDIYVDNFLMFKSVSPEPVWGSLGGTESGRYFNIILHH